MSLPLIHPKFHGIFNLGVAVVAGSVAAAFSRNEAVKIVALTTLWGVGSAVISLMLTCRYCIEFYTVDNLHNYQALPPRIIRSLNPNVNAILGGILDGPFDMICGVVLAVAARVPATSRLINASQVARYVVSGLFVKLCLSHIRAYRAYSAPKIDSLDALNVPFALLPRWNACRAVGLTDIYGTLFGTLALAIAIVAHRAGLIRL
jgi:hypothetical protein